VVAVVPYSIFVMGKVDPNPPSPTKVFKDFSGYEMAALRETAKYFNFDLTFRNPVDKKWGAITANRTGFSGMVITLIKNIFQKYYSSISSYFFRLEIL